MLYYLFKRLLWLSLGFFILGIVLLFLISSAQKVPPQHISSFDVATSQQVLSETLAHLRDNNGRIALEFEQLQLDALLNVASYALPQARFEGVINPFGVALSVQAPLLSTGRSVRASCLLLAEQNNFSIVSCQLGKIPVPGLVANWLMRWTVRNTLTAPADEQLLRLFAKGRLSDNRLSFIDDNASPIALNLQPSLYNPVNLLQTDSMLAPDIMLYLLHLKQLQQDNPRERRLAFFALELLSLAQQQSHQANDVNQYHNASWALIVAFGNRRIIHYANSSIPHSQVPAFAPVLLSGRHDLTLHFLYSAAIKLISSAQLSQQIGTLKEIMDAAEGGSGFSFVDLAADRAGIAFASQLSLLPHVDFTLYNSGTFEQAIMPPLNGLPEGLTEQQIQQQLGGYDGEGFKRLEQDIMARIKALHLYSGRSLP